MAYGEIGMRIQPYLSFDGRCDEALQFYRDAIGAEIAMVMRWKDSPDQSMTTPANADKVMHSQFQVGDTVVMASDGRNGGQPEFKGFSLSLVADTEDEADRLFNALAAGGKVTMPMAKTFFSPRFGMVTDRFGVGWMVLIIR